MDKSKLMPTKVGRITPIHYLKVVNYARDEEENYGEEQAILISKNLSKINNCLNEAIISELFKPFVDATLYMNNGQVAMRGFPLSDIKGTYETGLDVDDNPNSTVSIKISGNAGCRYEFSHEECGGDISVILTHTESTIYELKIVGKNGKCLVTEKLNVATGRYLLNAKKRGTLVTNAINLVKEFIKVKPSNLSKVANKIEELISDMNKAEPDKELKELLNQLKEYHFAVVNFERGLEKLASIVDEYFCLLLVKQSNMNKIKENPKLSKSSIFG